MRPFAVRPARLALRRKEAICAVCSKQLAHVDAYFKLDGVVVIVKHCKKCLLEGTYEPPS